MARRTLDKVLASVFDCDDDFGHLDSESEDEEDEGVSAYTWQQQFGLEKLATLRQVVSTEPLASSSSSSSSNSRLCSGPEELFLDSAGALEKQEDFTGKYIIMHEKNGNSRAIISRVLGG